MVLELSTTDEVRFVGFELSTTYEVVLVCFGTADKQLVPREKSGSVSSGCRRKCGKIGHAFNPCLGNSSIVFLINRAFCKRDISHLSDIESPDDIVSADDIDMHSLPSDVCSPPRSSQTQVSDEDV